MKCFYLKFYRFWIHSGRLWGKKSTKLIVQNLDTTLRIKFIIYGFYLAFYLPYRKEQNES